MPMIKRRIIKGIPICSTIDVENVLHRVFLSVAELIQNQAGEIIDTDIFKMVHS
jgi:hypothetical protein